MLLEKSFKKHMRRIGRTMFCVIGLILLIAAVGYAQNGSDARAFFSSSVGDWIGTCNQSTDGKQAEDKYFHASIKQADANTFTGQFDYYRFDSKTGRPIPIGTSDLTVTIASDGTATSKISGKGIVMVEGSPKNQTHSFTETITPTSDGKMAGKGKGSISVSGMPLGLGKGGKVKDSNTVWAMNGGTLNLTQKIKVGFKALIINKSFTLDARYTAKRGTNIAEVMPRSFASAPNR